MITDVTVEINNQPLAILHGVKKGGVVKVRCKNGIPLNREWRNRFSDAKIDGCVVVRQNVQKPKKEAK